MLLHGCHIEKRSSQLTSEYRLLNVSATLKKNEGTAPETWKPFLYAQHGSVTTCVLGGVMKYS